MVADIVGYKYSKTYTAPDGNTAQYRSFKEWQQGKLATGNGMLVNTVQTSYNIGDKYSNVEVRRFYIEQIEQIKNSIDTSLPLEDQALMAFKLRNDTRTYARNLMADEDTRKTLDEKHPTVDFETIISSKMQREGLTRKEALRDIIETASKANEKVNKELGL